MPANARSGRPRRHDLTFYSIVDGRFELFGGSTTNAGLTVSDCAQQGVRRYGRTDWGQNQRLVDNVRPARLYARFPIFEQPPPKHSMREQQEINEQVIRRHLNAIDAKIGARVKRTEIALWLDSLGEGADFGGSGAVFNGIYQMVKPDQLNRAESAGARWSRRWARMLLCTTGLSTQTMMLTVPPHPLHFATVPNGCPAGLLVASTPVSPISRRSPTGQCLHRCYCLMCRRHRFLGALLQLTDS